jgi:hypothetical protein
MSYSSTITTPDDVQFKVPLHSFTPADPLPGRSLIKWPVISSRSATVASLMMLWV